jgi:uncharacterized RDD family membrane protein YckC
MMSTDDRVAPSVPAGLVLAPLTRRALGAALDQFLVLVPVAIGLIVSGFRPGEKIETDTLYLLNIIVVVVAFTYELVMVGFLGRTVGKFATGTRVVRADTGGRVLWIAAAQRAIVPALAAAIPALGLVLGAIVYGLVLLGPLRQGLHDRAAGTLVVRVTTAAGH